MNIDIYHYKGKDRKVDYIRKITGQRLKYKTDEGNTVNLVIVLEDKRGHGDQLVLANMQDIIKVKKDDNIFPTTTENINIIIESWLIRIMSNKHNPEFHHLTLESRLKYNEDYKRLTLSSDGWLKI